MDSAEGLAQLLRIDNDLREEADFNRAAREISGSKLATDLGRAPTVVMGNEGGLCRIDKFGRRCMS